MSIFPIHPADINVPNPFGDQQTHLDLYGFQVPIKYFDMKKQMIMTDPYVVFPSGNNFDKTTIDDVMQMPPYTDPISRHPIISCFPDTSLKTAINKFLDDNPGLKKKMKEAQGIRCDENSLMNYFSDKDELIIPAHCMFTMITTNRHLIWLYKVSAEEARFNIVNDLINDALFL